MLCFAPADALAQHTETGHRDVLEAAEYDAGTSVAASPVAGKSSGSSAFFEVTYEGFPVAAQAAFDYALDVWAVHIASSMPITVRAQWSELDENVLGSAGPSTLVSFQGAPYPETWYPPALAAALTGESQLNDGQYDIVATFNSSISWYMGHDALPPSGTYDFVTVVLHEIGHGLGLWGSFRKEDGDTATGMGCDQAAVGEGCWGYAAFPRSVRPAIFDRFVSDVYANELINTNQYPNPSFALASAYESGGLFFHGETSSAAYANQAVELFSPVTFAPGSSIAHLDEAKFPAGDPNSLMTSALARSEAIHSPGSLFCGMLQDMGWSLGSGCTYLLEQPYSGGEGDADAGSGTDEGDDTAAGGEEPAGETDSSPVSAEDQATELHGVPLITAIFPNPAASKATVHLSTGKSQQATLTLYDVIGREVKRQNVLLRARSIMPVELDLTGLKPGFYVISVSGPTGSVTKALVVNP